MDFELVAPKYPLTLNPRVLWSVFFAQSIGFRLACVYLLFEYVRPQSIWPIIDIVPYAQLAVILGWICVFVEKDKKSLVATPFAKWLIGFSLVVTLSSVFAYDSSISWGNWDVFFPWIVICFLIIKTVTTHQRWYLFFLLFLIFSFKMSQHGFRTWAGRGFSVADWGVVGAPGFFHNSGEVGIQMCIFLPLSYCFAQELWAHTGRLGKAFLIAMPITAISTVIASNSRGAIIGAMCAMAWLLIPSGKRIKGAFVLSVVTAFGYLITPDATLARFTGIGSDKTSISRLTYWEDAWDMMRENPFLGIGYENWIAYYGRHYSGSVAGYEEVHNILLQAGSELGWLGLLTFLGMLFACFRMTARIRKEAGETGDSFSVAISRGLDASMVGFFISGQFVTVLYYPYFWIGASMISALYISVLSVADVRPRKMRR